MVITASQAMDEARRTLGGSPTVEARRIVNDAGRLLTTARAWHWLQRSYAQLDERAPISITGATWTESTRTLTKTAGFTNYTHRGGDRIDITAGTGATLGEYPIQNKVSADAIILGQSIGAAADGQTNIAGTIRFPYLTLPADFRAIVAIQATRGLVNSVEQTTIAQLLDMRFLGIAVASFQRWVAVGYETAGYQTTAAANTGGAPLPRLELYPTPTAASHSVLSLVYRAGWTDISDDQNLVSIPPFMEPLYLYAVQVCARGFDEEDRGDMADRHAKLVASTLFAAAARDDSSMQSNFGVVENGAAMRGFSSVWPYNFTAVANPS